MWETESGESIGEPWKAEGSVLFLSYTHDDSTIVIASANETDYKRSGPDRTVILPPSFEARCHYLGDEFNGDQVYGWAKQTMIQVRDASALARQKAASHSHWVKSVSFSPDGKQIVSGSYDGSVRVWDAETGDEVRIARMKHPRLGPVFFATFSPDGKHIASGGVDPVVRIWDAETGSLVRALEGHSYLSIVACGAYSPDGARIVSGSSDHTLRLWSTENWCLVGNPLTGHSGWVHSVAFSPDGSLIVSTSSDTTARLWDGLTGEHVGETGHTGRISSVVFSPDSTLLAMGFDDYTIRLWDMRKKCIIGGPLEGHENTVISLGFFPGWSTPPLCWNGSYNSLLGCLFRISSWETICWPHSLLEHGHLAKWQAYYLRFL